MALPKKGSMRLICRCTAFLALFALGGLCTFWSYNGEQSRGVSGVSSSSRELLDDQSVDSLIADAEAAAKFPAALAPEDMWMIALLIPLIFYMFLALAIICDEYFVPALEVICDEDNLNLSDDVAGATFMAAGGSAPELFTSFIGTMQESSVGFGTIVGSAVFNVLFVIAMCAFFSKELLTLTWWPLARDSIYYTFSLLMLALFFGFITPNVIDGWEAAILFAMYFGYVVLMLYNERLYVWLGFAETSDDPEKGETTTNPLQDCHAKRVHGGFKKLVMSGFSATSHADQAALHVVTKMEGDVFEIWNRLSNGNNEEGIQALDLKVLFEEMDMPANEEEVEKVRQQLDLNGDGVIVWEEFKEWYNNSEDRVRSEMAAAFDKIAMMSMMAGVSDPDTIDIQGLRAVLKEIGGMKDMSEDNFETAVDLAMVQIDTNDDGMIQRDEFYRWYETSMFWTMKNRDIDGVGISPTSPSPEEDEEDDGVEPLVWPAEAGVFTKIFWIISLPLNVLFVFTVPNCENEDAFYTIDPKRLAWPAFVLSIVWIGMASFVMVWGATIVGDTAGIPAQIMGLTFLAAGTSVPDLLSSIVVAQQGKGDMAVSSSIGSNIFDVLVGLPLPWIAYTIIKQKSVVVGAKSLQVSILILVGMLVAVIFLIKISGWALTKGLGCMMLALYFIFVLQDLLRDEDLICDGGCF